MIGPASAVRCWADAVDLTRGFPGTGLRSCGDSFRSSQDLNQAIHWCRLAADQGDRTAQHNLSLLEEAKESLQATMSGLARTNYEKVAVQRCDSDGIMVRFEPGKGGIGLAKVKTEELAGSLHQLCSLLTDKSGSQALTWSLQKTIGPALGTL